MNKKFFILICLSLVFLIFNISCINETENVGEKQNVDLSPLNWKRDYEKYYGQLNVTPTNQAVAIGENGAIAVGYYGLASRAGLEAMKQGGNAIDAAITTALTQIALDGGGAISYFGVMNLVYYEANSGKVYTMDGSWNSILKESDPLSIPGGIPNPFREGGDTRKPSGRTALVGGFMKGVESAHNKFGKLPFAELFKPSIYIANEGYEVGETFYNVLKIRKEDLKRLPTTKSKFFKNEDEIYQVGDNFKQPELARTLDSVARMGADYMYKGSWGKELVKAIQSDSGYMTMEDLKKYEVLWNEPLVSKFGNFELHTLPNNGGKLMVEALNLAIASGLTNEPHWSTTSESFRKALMIAQATMRFDFMSDEEFAELYPNIPRNDSTRVSKEYAQVLWKQFEQENLPRPWKSQDYKSSDVVVAIDSEGNIAAMDHSIATVLYGKTAIVVGGITISDAGSMNRKRISRIQPGSRLHGISKIGILTSNEKGVLGFASKGGGMHHKSFQGLINYIYHNMAIDEAVNSPDFFTAGRDSETKELFIRVPNGRFSSEILEGTGWHFEEISEENARASGEGVWIGVSIDYKNKELKAASHPASNSASFAY